MPCSRSAPPTSCRSEGRKASLLVHSGSRGCPQCRTAHSAARPFNASTRLISLRMIRNTAARSRRGHLFLVVHSLGREPAPAHPSSRNGDGRNRVTGVTPELASRAILHRSSPRSLLLETSKAKEVAQLDGLTSLVRGFPKRWR